MPGIRYYHQLTFINTYLDMATRTEYTAEDIAKRAEGPSAVIVGLYYETEEPPKRAGRSDEEYAEDFLQWGLYEVIDAGLPIDEDTGEEHNLFAYYNRATKTIHE